MNIIILGAAGFLGTNIAIKLAQHKENFITLIDKNKEWFTNIERFNFSNVEILEESLDQDMDFSVLKGQDIVYHLVSTNVPSNSNQHISHDIQANVLFSLRTFDACIEFGVKKIVFISSGGTVYGKEAKCPLSEDDPTNPITSYGVQKVTIEKLLYLYNYTYGIDYKIIRLSNPYGPYQRPNGLLGVVTTFVYKALNGEQVYVYGDGSVVRDFIYIDDVIRAIENIVNIDSKYNIFNLGCGYGTSIKTLIKTIESTLDIKVNAVYKKGRTVDIPVNFLDMSRYEACYGRLNPISLEEGIKNTVDFLKKDFMR